MDSLRSFEDEPGIGVAVEEESAIEAPPEIGIDERRMHVRAYNYWVSLLGGRLYPSIADLDPHSLDDFGPNSVLLDFSDGSEDPKIAYLGAALREECDLSGDIGRISEVPKRSLLSRLTDHYLQIIANSAPIGFEAEFVGQRGHNTMYRGILMPFTSTGEGIDFIYGVINWKEVADGTIAAEIQAAAQRAIAAAPAVEASPVWADGPNADPLELTEPAPRAAAEESPWDAPELDLGLDAGLGDHLSAARECAEAAKSADARSRAALYAALGHAYDLALAAERNPNDYAELLEDSGITFQARAPMTPIVKLVFGADYDKARVTEFAAALGWARREGLPAGAFRAYAENHPGGLKALVQAERRARRPETKPDTAEAARQALRTSAPVALLDIDAGEEEFVVLVARREGSGRLAIVSGAVTDRSLVDRAIRKAAS